MFRLIFFIIYIIIYSFIAVSGGRRGYRNRDIFFEYGTNNYSYTDVSDWMQARIKRFIAIRRAKNYITKYRNSYSLRNRNVTLIYNYNDESVACMNIRERQQNFKVQWMDYKDNHYIMQISDILLRNSFAEVFNRLCVTFNYNTTYEDIMNIYRGDYEIKYGSVPVKNKPKKENTVPSPVYVDEYFSDKDKPKNLLNINTATLDEIKSLPGINIVMAKRIIKYREENGGFKSVQELYNELKIKPHFQKQLNELIYVQSTGFPKSSNKMYNYDLKTDEDRDIIIDNLDLETSDTTEKKTETKKNSDRIIDF